MDRILAEIETQDLSGSDLVAICEGQVEVVPYHELNKYKSIEDLLEKYGAVIILYEIRENFGHYTALLYDNTNTLEFFDSYGFKPDQELKYATYNAEQGVPYLTKLIADYKKPINYSSVKLQKFVRDVNTCGRWTSCRVRLRKKYNLKQFQDLFNKNKYYNGDFFVSALTYLYTLK
tara:strand:- start:2732 stop:3259 length:528 start_codon:yes stop_codon:yes gene_type:complete